MNRTILHSVALVTSAVTLAALGACDRQQETPQQMQQYAAPDRGATFAQDSTRDWFIENALTGVPGTEAELYGMVGEPDSVLRTAAPKIEDPMAFDTVVEVFYPGLMVSLLKVEAYETVQSVLVADTLYLIGPIRPGTDSTTLVRLLGPAAQSRNGLGYACGECGIGAQNAFFQLANGAVSSVLFTYPGN